jgi:predicted naringenin-chalcone synthase
VALTVHRRLCTNAGGRDGWLPALYAHSDIQTRYTSIDQDVVTDLLDCTDVTKSPFLPGAHPEGPTTGDRLRHYAARAPGLAEQASRQALAASGRTAADLTHLVTVSCTGFLAPGVDIALMKSLSMPPTVQRTHIGFMGCHGAINGLRVARAYADADPSARILLCAVELCTLHMHYGADAGKMVANALFADGAAAVVAVPHAQAPSDAWRVAATGSCLLPDSAADMTWTIGDHGFEMTLSRAVPRIITEGLRPWLESWLAKEGLTLSQVGSWCVHPGGPRILTAVQEGLSLPPTALATSRAVFGEFGNMSSPTVLFILDRLRVANAPRPCLALGFGPGMVAEAALIR